MSSRNRAIVIGTAIIFSAASVAYAQDRGVGATNLGRTSSSGPAANSINSNRGGSPPANSAGFGNPYTSGSSGTSTTTGGAGTAGLPPR